MPLIKTTEELKENVPINGSFTYDNVLPYVNEVERDFIIPVISRPQYIVLHAAYNAGTATAKQLELLSLLQIAISNFAFMLYIPTGQIQISDSGIHIISNETKKTAFEWQIRGAQRRFLNAGFAAIEPVYEFLEENKAEFPVWVASSAFSFFKESFINTAKDFTLYVDKMNNSRRMFMAVKSSIRRVEEFVIKNTIGIPLYTVLKAQILVGTISEDNKILLGYIKPAVAHLAFAQSIIDMALTIDEYGISVYNTNATLSVDAIGPASSELLNNLLVSNNAAGEGYLDQLRRFLLANAATYPLFPLPPAGSSAQVINTDRPIYIL